jgi:hypothetical protein
LRAMGMHPYQWGKNLRHRLHAGLIHSFLEHSTQGDQR